MKRFKTLRFRFALWTALLLFIVLLLFGSFVYVSLWRGLSNSIDDSIRLSSSQAIAAVNVENGNINISDIYPEGVPSDLRERGLTIRIISKEGVAMASIGPFRNLPIDSNSILNAKAGISSFSTIRVNDSETVRVYTAPIEDNQNIIGFIQVMQSLETLHETLDQLLLLLLISIPALVIISYISGYFLAARTLSPIDQITQMAQKISTKDLSARLNLPGNDDEIGRLANTFDNMLARLEDGFKREHQFTSNASHELRTPLTAMQSILSVTRGRKRSSEEYEKAMDDLSEEIDRMRSLTEDLLYIARGNSLSVAPNEVVDLSILLNDVCEIMQPMAELKRLVIRSNVQSNLSMMGDSDALIRAFVNLLDNAIKYTDRGVILIEARAEKGNNIEIVIADTGRGIDPEHLPHIFERFYRVDESRSTPGFGLGLAIVHEIVRAHRGSIEVTSQVGSGTTFHLHFSGLMKK